MTEPTRARFGFRPRFRMLAWLAVAFGSALAAVGLFGMSGSAAVFAVSAAAVGASLGGLYLRSPVWRYQVLIDDEALEVLDHRRRRKFRLPWIEVASVVASPTTQTLCISGGSAERTLIVPGLGAGAPYDISDKALLYQAIMERVPAHTVRTVALLRESTRDRT